MKVKFIIPDITSGPHPLRTGQVYEVLEENETSYFLQGTPTWSWWYKDGFEVINEEVKIEPKQSTICPCGIHRADCEYHK